MASLSPVGCVVGDNIVFFIGRRDYSRDLGSNRFEIYNPESGSWTIATSSVTFYEPSIVGYNGKLIIGGSNMVWGYSNQNVYMLDF